jgi:hypothetical protein
MADTDPAREPRASGSPDGPILASADLFRHVTADKAAFYRAIMAVFAAARRQYRLQLRPEEVLVEADWPGTPPSREEVAAALTQLTDWGNLESQPDMARKQTLADFYRAHNIYRLSRGGEAVEAGLEAERKAGIVEGIEAGYARAQQLVGNKDPRQHEFTAQLRAFDAAKTGGKVGVGSLVALCTALLKRSVRGGLIVIGEINLGGSIEPVHDPVNLVELGVEKGASAVLMPVSCRRQLIDLSDDRATRVDIQFYADARDCLLKAIQD